MPGTCCRLLPFWCIHTSYLLTIGKDIIPFRIALAQVYQSGLKNERTDTRAIDRLRLYLNDEDEEVRARVSWAFANLDGRTLLKHRSFILEFIASPAFLGNTDELLRSGTGKRGRDGEKGTGVVSNG